MPYVKTGRPPGRPRKQPLPPAEPAQPVRKLSRARRAFREQAERLAPTEAVRIFGRRPRRKPTSQNRIA